MKSKYTSLPLRDVVELVIDYRGKTPQKLGSDWSTHGYRALSARNIKTGQLVQPDNINYVDHDLYKRWMKEEIRRGDILITSEAPFGEVLQWNSDEKIVLSQRLFALRCKENFHSSYVYYYMTSYLFQEELRGRATGTTVTGLRQPELLKCMIQCPSYQEQCEVASILRCLDDKIEINNRINKTLEQMAQAIFKSWFVDFEPWGGVMPEGWNTCHIGDISVELNNRINDAIDLEVLSAVRTGDLIPSNEYFTKQVYSKNLCKYKVIEVNDFAYNPMRLNIGSIGTNDRGKTCCVSPDYITFRAKPNYHYFLRFVIRSQSFKEAVGNFVSGSVRQRVYYKQLKMIDTIHPDDITLEEFNQLYGALEKQMSEVKMESAHLAALRDTLLPRRMSGELPVPTP